MRDAAQMYGRAYAETFAVVRDDTSGKTDLQTIAIGSDLVERALAFAILGKMRE